MISGKTIWLGLKRKKNSRMKAWLSSVLFLCMLSVLGQDKEQDAYAAQSTLFKEGYNKQDHAAVFAMFNATMKQAVPLERAQAFLSQTYATLGIIEEMRFHKIDKGAHVYRTVFDKGARDMVMVLDEEHKIAGFLIQPNKPDDLPVLERNTTKMILPFKGEWFVFWGGTEVAQNYHVAYENQKYDYDLSLIHI